ncbi:hypothetical protein MTO96_013955 [Rhipicephalus appendiculatus]
MAATCRISKAHQRGSASDASPPCNWAATRATLVCQQLLTTLSRRLTREAVVPALLPPLLLRQARPSASVAHTVGGQCLLVRRDACQVKVNGSSPVHTQPSPLATMLNQRSSPSIAFTPPVTRELERACLVTKVERQR